MKTRIIAFFCALFCLLWFPVYVNGETPPENPSGVIIINDFNNYCKSVSIDVSGLDQASKYNIFLNQIPLADSPLALDQPLINIKEILAIPDQLTFEFYDQSNQVVSTATVSEGNLYISPVPTDECFIATAAFGSKLQPSVVLLRQFRDNFLLTNSLGNKLVSQYYESSPPIARYIAQSNYLKMTVRILLLPLIVLAFLCLHPQSLFILFILSLLIAISYHRKIKWKQGTALILLLGFTCSLFNISYIPEPVYAIEEAPVLETGSLYKIDSFSGTTQFSDITDESIRVGKDIYTRSSRNFDVPHLLASIKFGGNHAYVKQNNKWFNILTLYQEEIGQNETAERDYIVSGWQLRYWYKPDIDISELVDTQPPLLLSVVQNIWADSFILQMNEKVKYPDPSTLVYLVRNDDNTMMAGTIQGYADETNTSLLIKTEQDLTNGIWTVKLGPICDEVGNISSLQLGNLIVERENPLVPVLSITNDNNQILLSWGPISEATSFKIKRGESINQLVEIASVTDTSYIDSTANPDSAYFYAVSSIAHDLESSNSNVVCNKTVITIDQVNENDAYITDADLVTLSGSVFDSNGVCNVECTYQSVLSDMPSKFAVTGTDNWIIYDLPVEIGSNYVDITATNNAGIATTKRFVVNRLSTEIELKDNIKAFDVSSPQGELEVGLVYDGIIDFWTKDMGTPDDSSDDEFYVLVTEGNPLLNRIRNGDIAVGDIIMIPPCEKFVNGFSTILLGNSEADDLTTYPAQQYEVLHTRLPGIADLFNEDVSLELSDCIDPDNPIAFALLPDGTEVYSETNGERSLLAFSPALDNDNTIHRITEGSGSVYCAGFQYANLARLAIPTVDFSNASSILFKFADTIIYDKDGDKDPNGNTVETDHDRITVNGEMGMENLSTQIGLEWHPNLADVLPQQFICKLSYDNVKNLQIKSGSSVALNDLVREFNKTMNRGFENKRQFMGMSIDGAGMSDSVILGAIGFNITTGFAPQVANISTIQSASVLVPFNPIIVVMLVLDINGELHTEITFDFKSRSYVEKGFNVQKEGFIGAYGSLNSNRGQKSINLAFNRSLEIYDIEARSKNEKDKKPLSTLTISASGTAEEMVGFGPMIGLMMCGIMPATIKATGYMRANANLNGSLILSSDEPARLEGFASAVADAGVRVKINLNLMAKTALGNPGIVYSPSPWEYKFVEFSIATTGLTGKVSRADADRDASNNPVLSGVKVQIKKNNLLTAPTLETYTNEYGEYLFSNLASGEYTLTVSHPGFLTYIDEHFNLSATGTTLNIVLDPNSFSTLSGVVTIADDDTNMTNNQPLPGVSITARKVGVTSIVEKMATTDANGAYSINDLTPGLYYITYTKSNYLEISQDIVIVEGQETIYNTALEAISEDYNGNGDAGGTVLNALTGLGVESGLTLVVRKGYNNLTEGGIVTTAETGINGNYLLTLPAGNYCVEVIDNRIVSEGDVRYQNGSFNIKVLGGTTILNQNGVVTPTLPEGQIRIVLRWGQSPNDLDSHLIGPKADLSGSFHIYYWSKTYYAYDNSINTKFADLDVDDTSSWGPETTTIYKQSDGIYRFYVHNYSNRGSNPNSNLANSGAYVEIYIGNNPRPVAIYYVPQLPGTLWGVFEYNSLTQAISALNTMSYESSSGNVGHNSLGINLEDNPSRDVDSIEADIIEIAESVKQNKE